MKLLFTSLLILLFMAGNSYAQIVDRTEDKAKQKTNQRIDNKIDKGIDQGLDAIEGLFGKKKKDSKDQEEPTYNESADNDTEQADAISEAMLKMLGGGGSVEVKDAYDFDSSIDMTMQSFDKNGKQEFSNDFTMLLSNERPHTGMIGNVEGYSSLIVFDMEAHQMLTFSDAGGQKMGFVMGFDPTAMDQDSDEEAANANVTFKATGKTRKISGFNCMEYLVENTDDQEDMDISLWMTTETDMNWMEAFGSMSNGKNPMGASPAMPSTYPEGAMIEMVAVSKGNGEKNVTTVTSINKNDKRNISTSGYTFMNMGGK